MSHSQERIGLIAGTGTIITEFVSRAHELGREVAVAALSKDSFHALKGVAESIARIPPTQPKKIVRFFHDEGVKRVGMVGKVEKKLIFQSIKFDSEAVRFFKRARNMADTTIMDALIDFARRNDLEIVPQTEFLDHLLTPEGNIGRRSLKADQRKDAFYAFRIARELARLDVGQTVVVRKGAVVAVEAIEGTDESIRRGCKFAGAGAVVCKVARPRQDPRFDVPSVGPDTLQVLREGRAAALIVEAGRTFLLDRERLVEEAEAAKIALVGWTESMGP